MRPAGPSACSSVPKDEQNINEQAVVVKTRQTSDSSPRGKGSRSTGHAGDDTDTDSGKES